VLRLGAGPASAQLFERITRQDSRGHATLVACLASIGGLQHRMPHFLLTRDGTLSAAEKRRLRALRAPLVWLEGSNGWMTTALLCNVLTHIRRSVLAAAPNHEIVLLLDAAPMHVHPAVLGHAARLRLHLLFVPSKMTWLLQPLDTHVFASLKATLHALQLQQRALGPDGHPAKDAWVGLVETAVHQLLVDRQWAAAFAENGLAGQLPPQRQRLLDVCGSIFPVPRRPPTTEELHFLLGRKVPNLAARVTSRSQRLAALPAPAAAEALPAVAALPPLPPPAAPPDSMTD
jgi:hypothetical protein